MSEPVVIIPEKKYQYFRELSSGNIVAVFENCRTNSSKFKNVALYEEILTDIPMVLNRVEPVSNRKSLARLLVEKGLITQADVDTTFG